MSCGPLRTGSTAGRHDGNSEPGKGDQGLPQRQTGGPGPGPGRGRGGADGAGGAVGLGQDHGASDGGGPGGHQLGHAAHGGQGRERPGPQGPQRGHGVPELRPVPPHDGGREHRFFPEAAQGAQVRGQVQGQRRRQPARPHRLLGAQALPALWRPAPAGGHGPGHRERAVGVLDGRAASATWTPR